MITSWSWVLVETDIEVSAGAENVTRIAGEDNGFDAAVGGDQTERVDNLASHYASKGIVILWTMKLEDDHLSWGGSGLWDVLDADVLVWNFGVRWGWNFWESHCGLMMWIWNGMDKVGTELEVR